MTNVALPGAVSSTSKPSPGTSARAGSMGTVKLSVAWFMDSTTMGKSIDTPSISPQCVAAGSVLVMVRDPST